MIKSQFIKDILDLLLDCDGAGLALRPQIDFLEEKEYDYTGVGLFVYFNFIEGIQAIKYQDDPGFIDGVNIWSTALNEYAYAGVFCKEGIIDSLEIFAWAGDYPKGELTDYIMRQEWGKGPKREIWCKDGKRKISIL